MNFASGFPISFVLQGFLTIGICIYGHAGCGENPDRSDGGAKAHEVPGAPGETVAQNEQTRSVSIEDATSVDYLVSNYFVQIIVDARRAFRIKPDGTLGAASGYSGKICATKVRGSWTLSNGKMVIAAVYEIPAESCGDKSDFSYSSESARYSLSELSCTGTVPFECKTQIEGMQNVENLCDYMTESEKCEAILARPDTYEFVVESRP
jgi:hypothetical protein